MIILRQKEFGKISSKVIEHFIKKSKENTPEDKELYDKILKENHKEAGVDKIRISKNRNAYRGQKTIELSKDVVDKGKFSSLAHEMGHAYHYSNKKSKLGRAFHRLDEKINEKYWKNAADSKAIQKEISEKYRDYDFANKGTPKELENKVWNISKSRKRLVGSSVSGISGVAAGYKSEEEKEKGNKKKARLISAGSLAVPVLGHTPELGREISASSKAMKMIKAAGANKKQVKAARKSLGYSLGTYGVGLGKNLIINSGGQLVGKGAYKLTHKKKKEDKE